MSTLQNEEQSEDLSHTIIRSRVERPAGELIVPQLWANKERIKNLGNAITEMAGGKIFISAQEVATIFEASESAIRKIPEKKLNRLKRKGEPTTKYTAFDLAHYCVHHPDCKVLRLGKEK